MPIRIPDVAVLDSLIAGEAIVLADMERWIPDIFDGRSTLEQAKIKEYLRLGVQTDDPEKAQKYRVKKFLGYPNTPEELPCWAVTLSMENEAQQAIGNVLEDSTPGGLQEDAAYNRITYGAIYEGIISIACYSPNPMLTVYLQALAKYILLYQRTVLEDAGYHTQRLSCNDLRPDPQSHPDFTFVREIRLSCRWENYWVETPPTIAGVELDPTYETPDGSLTWS